MVTALYLDSLAIAWDIVATHCAYCRGSRKSRALLEQVACILHIIDLDPNPFNDSPDQIMIR